MVEMHSLVFKPGHTVTWLRTQNQVLIFLKGNIPQTNNPQEKQSTPFSLQAKMKDRLLGTGTVICHSI
jgi:hypothetical protein